MRNPFGDFDPYFDSNGCLTERSLKDGLIVHYDDIPETDVTVIDGIPVTTALRTVIDIAPDIDRDQLEAIVQDCLDRRLFSVDEARDRVDELDMLHRPGAQILRRLLFG